MNKGFVRMNQKGVFITLTALFLAGMLLLAAGNLQLSKTIEDRSINLGIASERTYFVGQSVFDSIRDIYKNAQIEWRIEDNNFIYFETFPNSTFKNKIFVNVSKLKSFFYYAFPSNVSFSPENVDLGEIMVYGKDLNVKHSSSTGFGDNKTIYLKYSSRKFNTIQIDLNISAGTVSNLNQTLPLCSSCSNPVNLIINARNSAGTIQYSFNNVIDYAQVGLLDLNTSPSVADILFRYSPTDMNVTANSSTVSIATKFVFDSSSMDVGLNKNILSISEMSSFGVNS